MRKGKNSKSTNNKGNFERKDMTGGLFVNSRKDPDNEDDDNKPDLTGVIKVYGEELRIAAWAKESRNGDEYFSLSIQEFDYDYQKPEGEKKTTKKVASKKRNKYEEEDEVDSEDSDDETDDDSADNNETEVDDEEADEEELTPPKKGSSKPKAIPAKRTRK